MIEVKPIDFGARFYDRRLRYANAMGVMQFIIRCLLDFMSSVFASPVAFCGLITIAGLMASKKDVGQIVVGTAKSMIGISMVFIGAQGISTVLWELSSKVEKAFGGSSIIPATDPAVAYILGKYDLPISGIVLGGFAFNMFIARTTPLKFVFLSGHHIVYMATLLASILRIALGIDAGTTLVLGSIILGLSSSLLPWVAQPYMRRITGVEGIGLGHFGSLGYVLGGLIGGIGGARTLRSGQIEVPKYLEWFTGDVAVSSALVVGIMFYLTSLMPDVNQIQRVIGASASGDFAVASMLKGVQFAACLAVILQGMRLLVAHLVPAFRYLSEKVVPGAIPGLPCQVVYEYSPNAVLIGFVSSVCAGLATTFIMHRLNFPFVVPPIAQHFFEGGTGGVFGDATGGFRGAIIGGMVCGILFTVLPLLLWPYTAPVSGNLTYTDPDFCLVGAAVGYIGKLLKVM